jgi:hypothetical protein
MARRGKLTAEIEPDLREPLARWAQEEAARSAAPGLRRGALTSADLERFVAETRRSHEFQAAVTADPDWNQRLGALETAMDAVGACPTRRRSEPTTPFAYASSVASGWGSSE